MFRTALLILLAISCAAVGIATPPAAAEVFTTRYQCYDRAGASRWEATTTIEPQPGAGRDVYLIRERGHGKQAGYAGIVTWDAHAEFISTADAVTPIVMQRDVYASDGEHLVCETQRFDRSPHAVTVTRTDFRTQQESTRTFTYTGEITNQLLLGLFMQKFLARGERSRTVALVSNEPSLYYVDIRVVATEDLTIAGTASRAYKLILDPRIGILSPLKLILPKAYVWHAATPPHAWLQYRGVESTVHSPTVTIITADQLPTGGTS